MRPAAAPVAAPPARHPADQAAAAVRLLTLGTSSLLLLLYLVAAAAAGVLGAPWGAAAAALDPALPGSLPDLWGMLQLAGVVLLVALAGGQARDARLLRVAVLVPLVLLVADASSAGARLAPFASLAGGKLLANALLGGMAAAPAVVLWLGSCPAGRRLGRYIGVRLVSYGAAAATLDELGSFALAAGFGPAVAHGAVVAEEAVELLLYATLAGRLIGALLSRCGTLYPPASHNYAMR